MSDDVCEDVVNVDKLWLFCLYDVDMSCECKGKVEVNWVWVCIFDCFELLVIVIC